MSTGITIVIFVFIAILVLGATTMVLLTFRNTRRRRGSEADEEVIKREVRENSPSRDLGEDSNPEVNDTPHHGRHEFR